MKACEVCRQDLTGNAGYLRWVKCDRKDCPAEFPVEPENDDRGDAGPPCDVAC